MSDAAWAGDAVRWVTVLRETLRAISRSSPLTALGSTRDVADVSAVAMARERASA
jgi:hypothetical protein